MIKCAKCEGTGRIELRPDAETPGTVIEQSPVERTEVAVGAPVDLTYPVSHLGNGADTLASLAAGEGDFAVDFCTLCREAELIEPDGLG